MKQRPRSVERKVAEVLSAIYERYGYASVERIPILGRTGPDIEINQAGLVVDVKSRVAVPQSHLLNSGDMGIFGDYVGVRVGELEKSDFRKILARPSSMVRNWIEHMDDWRKEHAPSGISVIVLHRPGTRIANATFVVYPEEWNRVRNLFGGGK